MEKTMELSEYDKGHLDALLAKATGAEEDYSRRETELLVEIGKGIFWSQRLDEMATALAEEVRQEFLRFSNLESFK